MNKKIVLILLGNIVSLMGFSQTRWWNNETAYEIFVRSFCDSNGYGIGDFNGITKKIDYLNDGYAQ